MLILLQQMYDISHSHGVSGWSQGEGVCVAHIQFRVQPGMLYDRAGRLAPSQ